MWFLFRQILNFVHTVIKTSPYNFSSPLSIFFSPLLLSILRDPPYILVFYLVWYIISTYFFAFFFCFLGEGGELVAYC